MARGSAVRPQIVLPPPPEHGRYDLTDQRELRRLLQMAIQPTQDYGTLVSVPTPIVKLGTIPDISPLALLLLGDTTETAMRSRINIAEHQSSVTITTGSLANLATETGTLALPDLACDLISIVADRACWVTLYTTAAARTADGARLVTALPTAGTGVLTEFVPTGAMTVPCSPIPRLANGDGAGGIASTPLVYYRIMNRSGAPHTVAVTFHFGALP
jgi:hypothetical protein